MSNAIWYSQQFYLYSINLYAGLSAIYVDLIRLFWFEEGMSDPAGTIPQQIYVPTSAYKYDTIIVHCYNLC